MDVLRATARWHRGLIARGVFAVLVIVAFIARPAAADTIYVDFSHQSGNVFNYVAELSDSGVIEAGNGFTIFDFAGPTGTFVVPSSDWTVQTSLQGSPIDPMVAQLGALMGDSGVLPNIHFIWSGSQYVTPGPLGTFSITSLYTNSTMDTVASKDSSGGTALAFGTVTVAAIGPLTESVVAPLPASVWSGLVLFGLLGAVKWIRVRQAAVVA